MNICASQAYCAGSLTMQFACLFLAMHFLPYEFYKATFVFVFFFWFLEVSFLQHLFLIYWLFRIVRNNTESCFNMSSSEL